MKNKTAFLTSLLLTELLVLGGMACFVTGMRLVVSDYLLLALGVGVLVSCLLWALEWDLWLLLAAAGISIYALHGPLLDSLKTLGLILGKLYSSAYGWDLGDLFAKVNTTILKEDVTAACLFAGLWLGILLSYLLHYRRSLAVTLGVSLVPLAFTLVCQDTVPQVEAIFLLLVGLGLLLLTGSTRRMDLRQGSRLTAMLLVPVILAVSLLLVAVPQEGYELPDLSGTILSFLQDQPPPVEVPSVNVGGTSKNWVNLNQLGPKDNSTAKVMELTTSYSGHIYLRSAHYTSYNGLRWSDGSNQAQEDFTLQADYLRQMEDEISVTTLRAYDQLFLPYYPRDGEQQALEYGRLPNPRKLLEYTIQVRQLRSDWQVLWQLRNPRYTLEDMENKDPAMIALPAATLLEAQEYLDEAGITQDMSPLEAAQRIAAFVGASARYDIGTQRMPSEETDFALWFLEEAETGYCVHFATAAAVLLRAAGIPARYVEGYVAYLPSSDNPLLNASGVHVTVTRRMAHAWVEYYLPQVGWVLLEATPGGFLDDPEPTVPPTTEPSSIPPTTEPSTTAPTLPSRTTAGSSRPQNTAGSSGTASVRPEIQIPVEFLLALAWVAAVILALLLQWRLRLWALHTWLRRGSRRRQAMRRWKFAKFLAWLQKEAPPKALLALAQRAKFSQHPTSEEELAKFDAYFAHCVAQLRKKDFMCQLLYRWILAIY